MYNDYMDINEDVISYEEDNQGQYDHKESDDVDLEKMDIILNND